MISSGKSPYFSFASPLWTLTAIGFAASAPAAEVHVGDEVVVVRREAKIKIKAEVVAWPSRGEVYTVKQIQDGWYWVDDAQGLGWISSQDVALVETALEIFGKTIAKSPTSYNYRLRGWLHFRLGKYEKAIADFSEAIRINSRDFEAYSGRAESLRRQGDMDGALDDCDTVIRTLANDTIPWPFGYIYRALICAAGGKYEQALADCDKLIALDARQAGAYALAAWVFATCPDERFRDGKKAVEYGTTAVKLSRDENADRPAILAAAYAEAGDFAHAIEWQKKAISLALEKDRPDFAPALKLYESGQPFRDHAIGSSRRPRLYFETFIQ